MINIIGSEELNFFQEGEETVKDLRALIDQLFANPNQENIAVSYYLLSEKKFRNLPIIRGLIKRANLIAPPDLNAIQRNIRLTSFDQEPKGALELIVREALTTDYTLSQMKEIGVEELIQNRAGPMLIKFKGATEKGLVETPKIIYPLEQNGLELIPHAYYINEIAKILVGNDKIT